MVGTESSHVLGEGKRFQKLKGLLEWGPLIVSGGSHLGGSREDELDPERFPGYPGYRRFRLKRRKIPLVLRVRGMTQEKKMGSPGPSNLQ